jgi:hypothetical protein
VRCEGIATQENRKIVAVRNIALFVFACVCLAFPCNDPQLRSAVIGGHVIDASVMRGRKPLKHVKAQLFSGQKLLWAGVTGSDGRFTINDVPSGKYKLSVEKWGTVDVELKTELDVTGLGQHPSFQLLLSDETCVATTTVVN